MTALNAYTTAWKAIFKTSRMWLLVYGITFLIAAISILPLRGFMSNTLGNSLALNESLPGFDYTFIGDVLNEYGDTLGLLLNQSMAMVLLFFLVSVFLMGGILCIFKNRPKSFDAGIFWQGCSTYFWRLLRLSIYFLIFHFILFAVSTMIYFSVTNGMSPFETESEDYWILSFRIIGVIYLFFATFLFMVHDYTKWQVVNADTYLLTVPIMNTFGLVLKNFGKFFLLSLFNILTFLLVFTVYYFLKQTFTADTGLTILLLFLLTQIFVFTRIGLKLLNIAGVGLLYDASQPEIKAPVSPLIAGTMSHEASSS